MQKPRNALPHLLLPTDKPHALQKRSFSLKLALVSLQSVADPFFDKRRRFGLWQHGSATEAGSEPGLGFGTDLAIIKKHFGVYKPRLSCARAGRREVGMLRATCWGASSRQRSPPPPAPPAPRLQHSLKSAQTIRWCLLSFFTSHAGCFSPTHLPLHLLRLSHSLTSLGINSLRDLCKSPNPGANFAVCALSSGPVTLLQPMRRGSSSGQRPPTRTRPR